MTKEEDKKQGVVEHRGKIRKKKKNFDSVIEPIKNEDKNKRRKTHIFFWDPARIYQRARSIYKGRGSKCTRNITASTPRLSLVLVLLRR